MSATRSPKVSERVAPKAADPLPPKKKKHDDDDGPDFATLFRAWVENHRASLLDSEKLITGDKYTFIRNAYLQNREFKVKDGKVVDDF